MSSLIQPPAVRSLTAGNLCRHTPIRKDCLVGLRCALSLWRTGKLRTQLVALPPRRSW